MSPCMKGKRRGPNQTLTHLPTNNPNTLRRRGKVDKLGLCGVNGKKFPGIRAHMERAIAGQYQGLDMAMNTFPSDQEVDPQAYEKALEHFNPGDAVTIFTPGR